MNTENIHPLIMGWVENLLKPGTPDHIKENYANNLRNLNEFIVKALEAHTSDLAKASVFRKRR
jgi:hypothetical protein